MNPIAKRSADGIPLDVSICSSHLQLIQRSLGFNILVLAINKDKANF